MNHSLLTSEKLEEYVELVDWLQVPSYLITKEFVDKFSCFSKLRARFWFQEILNSLEVKVDEVKNKDRIFFFIGEHYFMDLEKKTGHLWCSVSKIWSVFETKYKLSNIETQGFIKVLVEQHFKIMVISPSARIQEEWDDLILSFKEIKVTPIALGNKEHEVLEQHFKNKPAKILNEYTLHIH